jgi:hypothetical protein
MKGHMSHLTLEELARFVDETPDRGAAGHLATCEGCAADLAALREQRDALRDLPALMPGPDHWPALRERLAREGLVRSRPRRSAGMVRAAAAAALFLAGGALGYGVRGPLEQAGPGSPAMVTDGAVPGGAGPGGAVADDATGREPTRAVAEAGEQFMAALDSYMEASGATPADPATRLAALDNIVLTTAAALAEAPADPVINSYHMSAMAQRDAVLRQLAVGAGLPVF